MEQILCVRCRIARDSEENDALYAAPARKLLDAEPGCCAWAALSDGQRDYLRDRGVSPERFCQLRQRATARWLAEWDAENAPELQFHAGEKRPGQLL